MRIARIKTAAGDEMFAVAHEEEAWIPLESMGIKGETTGQVIEALTQRSEPLDLSAGGESIQAEELLNPIVPPSKLLAIGMNYIDHMEETGTKQPENPILFAKFSNTLNEPYGRVIIDPRLTEKGDYEVELAVVIGKTTKGITEEDALDCVFGYTVANDVSARDWQAADGQFDRSKSFDTFCPIGPWITTADEVPDPQSMALKSWVNGEPRQDSSTKKMVFSVAYLIYYLARGMTLDPGDVILTGTPHGVGFVMDPPRHLAPGDIVECEVEGLGRIRNEIVLPDGV